LTICLVANRENYFLFKPGNDEFERLIIRIVFFFYVFDYPQLAFSFIF